MTTSRTRKTLFGGIGIFVGIVALAAAFLSPWIQEQIDPPSKPVEEVAVDIATRLASAAKAKMKGEPYFPSYTHAPRPSRFLFPTIIGAGMLGAILGVIGTLRSEDRRISGGAIAIGIGAAVVQWSLLVAGAVVLLFLVLSIMSFLGGGP